MSTKIHWTNPVNGLFGDPLDWTPQTVPGVGDDAVLDAKGGAYTVTVQAQAQTGQVPFNRTIDGIQTASNATLLIEGGVDVADLTGSDTVFTATKGTDGGVNAGLIEVHNSLLTGPLGQLLSTTATLQIAGTFANTGTVWLNGQEHKGDIFDPDEETSLFLRGNTILTGGGHVTLSGAAINRILGASPGVTFTNVNNIISGSGYLGCNSLTIVNQAAGVIEAKGAAGMVIGTHGRVLTNDGLIEAGPGAGLAVLRTFMDQMGGGVLEAAGGGHAILRSVDVVGGEILTLGTGKVIASGQGNVLDGRSQAVRVAGTFIVGDGAEIMIEGAIDNGGRVGVASSKAVPLKTNVIVGAAGATLSGQGVVQLSNVALNRIWGASGAATLTNVDNKISGSGDIGLGRLTLINGAKGGIVDGKGSVGLVIDTGANTIANAGAIEAVTSAGVTVRSAVDNTGRLIAYGGHLTVLGAVGGAGQATIRGGTLSFGSSFSENVHFVTAAPGTLELARSQSYGGTIFGFSHTGADRLDLRDIAFKSASEASFSGDAGGGELTVTDGTHTAHIYLAGDYAASSFVASSDGHGGTIVVDPSGVAAKRSASARFAGAMAAFAPVAAGEEHAPADRSHADQPLLVGPRAHFA